MEMLCGGEEKNVGRGWQKKKIIFQPNQEPELMSGKGNGMGIDREKTAGREEAV